MKKSVALFSLIAAALAAILLLSQDDVTVVVENVGTEPMRRVVVHVTGAAHPVGELAPGARAAVIVKPKGESHVEIEQASGQRLVVDCYFESGNSGTIAVKVHSTKVVAVKSDVRP